MHKEEQHTPLGAQSIESSVPMELPSSKCRPRPEPPDGEIAAQGDAFRPPSLVERLNEVQRDRVLAHVLRLSAADRRMRFCHDAADETLQRYVAAIDFEASCCFGAFDHSGALIALAEAIPFQAGNRRCAEAAFSTDVTWRGRGLAKAGLEGIKTWAAWVGIERVVLHCDARNAAMRGLLRSVNAETSVDRFEVDAIVLLEAMPWHSSSR